MHSVSTHTHRVPARVIAVLGVIAALVVLIALPVLAQTASPEPYQGVPTAGAWVGTAFFGPEVSPQAAEMQFEVNADSTLSGHIKFVFFFEGMADDIRENMEANGCLVEFDALTPDTAPVSGYFAAPDAAVGKFSATRCALPYYGDLEFAAAIEGVWLARAENGGVVDASAEADSAAVDSTSDEAAADDAEAEAFDIEAIEFTPQMIAQGKELFGDECSECHGNFGEGAPGTPELDGVRISRLRNETLLNTINNGVEGTEMTAYASQYTEEEKYALLAILRNMDALYD